MSEEHRIYLDGDKLHERSIPRASALPLFPPVRAAMEAVKAILRKEFVTDKEARERVRVEITHEIEMEIMRRVSADNLYLVHDPKQQGPMQIMGISFYVVRNLPEPGWRVRGTTM